MDKAEGRGGGVWGNMMGSEGGARERTRSDDMLVVCQPSMMDKCETCT